MDIAIIAAVGLTGVRTNLLAAGPTLHPQSPTSAPARALEDASAGDEGCSS